MSAHAAQTMPAAGAPHERVRAASATELRFESNMCNDYMSPGSKYSHRKTDTWDCNSKFKCDFDCECIDWWLIDGKGGAACKRSREMFHHKYRLGPGGRAASVRGRSELCIKENGHHVPNTAPRLDAFVASGVLWYFWNRATLEASSLLCPRPQDWPRPRAT